MIVKELWVEGLWVEEGLRIDGRGTVMEGCKEKKVVGRGRERDFVYRAANPLR